MKRHELLTRHIRPRTAFRTQRTDGTPTGTEGAQEGQQQGAQGQGQQQGAQGQQGAQQGDGTEGQQGTGVTFTPEQQSVIDGIVAERLSRGKAQWTKDEAAKKEREALPELERAKKAAEEAEARATAAEQTAKEARWEVQMSAQVTDTETALLVVKSNPEKYVDAAGKVKVDQLLKDKPFLKRATVTQTGPGTGGGMGGAGDPTKDLGAALAADRAAGRR